jgi:2,3,4,5-tetrahydropyridine-2-carboxylate N-succinyltransferase
MHSSKLITSHPGCYDKAPLKFETWSETDFEQHGIRAVPGSIVRKGAYIGKQVVLMPCFVNMGAYIDTGTMIDTHASVGSCAQVGRHCHISGGAGIGGVLEPEGALPTIIEDNCFIGARSEIAEGVVVGKGSVIAMGVYISASTKIFNTEDQSISYGYIPPYSVVVPGSIPYKGANIYCAMIIKQVTESTRKKTSINELLR